MLHGAPETFMFFCPSQLLSAVFCPSGAKYIFRFAKILDEFRWNSRVVMTTTNRLSDCILCKFETGTREQDTRENSNQLQLVLPRWRPTKFTNEFAHSLHRPRQMRSQAHFLHLKISYKYIKNFMVFFIHWTIIQYLSTADTDTSLVCSFIACHGNAVSNTFTTDVDVVQMQGRRHHMTACGL